MLFVSFILVFIMSSYAISNDETALALTEKLGGRLKQARLNADLTQSALAARAGLTRKAVINAEKGKAQLVVFVSLLSALGLTEQLNNFLPEQPISPIQLAKLHGKKRRRASGKHDPRQEETLSW